MTVVRNATTEDAAAIAALASELGYQSTGAQITARIADLEHPDHGVFVAEDGAVVGWIHVGIVRALEHDRFAEIHGLIVGESQRGRGIGAMLVERAAAWASERACPRLRVRTNIVRKDSIRFYERAGFREVKTQKVLDRALQ